MIRILTRYMLRQFFSLFLFCLLSVILIFLVVDLIENLDQFLDRNVSWKIIFQYYLYFIPYVIVLTMPVATLLATVFSIGAMARQNEMVAMKALGYSLYRVIRTLLLAGLFLSVCSFLFMEYLVTYSIAKQEEIERIHLKKSSKKKVGRLSNLAIQEKDQIVYMSRFDDRQNRAYRVKIESFRDNELVSKIDAPTMQWHKSTWIITRGFKRQFNNEQETAIPILDTLRFEFSFNPQELVKAQTKPDNMGFRELKWFVGRVKRTGGDINRLLTEMHLRISYPLSNAIIILFSVPMAYNRRKKNMALGFGVSLVVCFFYFGLVKMGQTMGQNGNVHPVFAAWLGNVVMCISGVVYLIKTRK